MPVFNVRFYCIVGTICRGGHVAAALFVDTLTTPANSWTNAQALNVLWTDSRGGSEGIGVSRGAVGAGAPPRERKVGGGAEFMGISCKCTTPPPRARVHPSEGGVSHFLLGEEGAAFNLGGGEHFIE